MDSVIVVLSEPQESAFVQTPSDAASLSTTLSSRGLVAKLLPPNKIAYQFFERSFDIFKDLCFRCISMRWESLNLLK